MTDLEKRLIGLYALIVLAAIGWHVWKPWERVERKAVVKVNDSAVDHSILDGSRKADRLIDRWPDAPRIMAVVAEVYNLPPALLPAIARAEGMTEKMHKARNPYGLEYKGKLLEFGDYFYSTTAAAQLLDRNREKWEVDADVDSVASRVDGQRMVSIPINGVDIDRLARWWCPVNARQWARNVKGAMGGEIK